MSDAKSIALIVCSVILGMVAVAIRIVLEWRDELHRKRAAKDALVYGVGIMRDGKRIHPRDFYQPPSQDSNGN